VQRQYLKYLTANWDHRLWGKCTDCEEKAQIVFLPQIETTDGGENLQTVRNIHRLYFYLKLRTQTVRKKHRLYFYLELRPQTVREMHRLYFYLEWRPQTVRKMHRFYFFLELRPQTVRKMHRLYFYFKLRPQTKKKMHRLSTMSLCSKKFFGRCKDSTCYI
jgi:hypothetical protein